jgi:GNAT superfamily N-acetyltransferase
MAPATPAITVRPARPSDAEWINERYAEVGFIPSDLTREFVAVAEIGRVRVGLGRVVPLGPLEAELGGMYVLDKYRGRGVADAIVPYLLQMSGDFRRVYCLPFGPLSAFYQKHGFHPCEDLGSVPEKVMTKHGWCNRQYPEKTLLYVLNRA